MSYWAGCIKHTMRMLLYIGSNSIGYVLAEIQGKQLHHCHVLYCVMIFLFYNVYCTWSFKKNEVVRTMRWIFFFFGFFIHFCSLSISARW